MFAPNIRKIIVITKNLKYWRDWPTELVIPTLTHINEIRRLATQTDLLKIERALSIPSEQYLSTISQGEKTPQYYRTARNHLHTRTQAQSPNKIPVVPLPMGNHSVSNPQPVRQPIPPPISQPVSLNYNTNTNSFYTSIQLNPDRLKFHKYQLQFHNLSLHLHP